MNCTRMQQMLDAYIDRELDRATSGDIHAHLAACAACAALHQQRMALRASVRAHVPGFVAPPTLAAEVHRKLRQATPSPQPRARSVSWFSAAALATLAALAGLLAGYWLAQPQADQPLRDAAVASHVASLAPKRQLVEVASNDRHTVKPWFQGKVDFAPPVKDLANENFVLLGGRLDQVADKPAAAVVYQIRKHVINYYVWRAADAQPAVITAAGVRGFSVVTWAAGGLRFAAVSDVDARDLTRFAQLMSAP